MNARHAMESHAVVRLFAVYNSVLLNSTGLRAFVFSTLIASGGEMGCMGE